MFRSGSGDSATEKEVQKHSSVNYSMVLTMDNYVNYINDMRLNVFYDNGLDIASKPRRHCSHNVYASVRDHVLKVRERDISQTT